MTTTRLLPKSLALILVVIVIATLVYMMAPVDIHKEDFVLYADHAVERHGSDAIAVENACQKGVLEEWVNKKTWRVAQICMIDEHPDNPSKEGKFGIRIHEQGFPKQRVTAFIKEKLTRIDQVRRNLMNGGYEPYIH